MRYATDETYGGRRCALTMAAIFIPHGTKPALESFPPQFADDQIRIATCCAASLHGPVFVDQDGREHRDLTFVPSPDDLTAGTWTWVPRV